MFAARFASEKGFDVIFDTSKDLPIELQNVACEDVTSEFIDRYNQQLAKAQK